ncbi:MAG TPA: hypothetical protein VMB46_04185, partial [Methanomassiliicoccales archaeon]|nr:hypothetical protein [Methanomassiliicoccales archaeon]
MIKRKMMTLMSVVVVAALLLSGFALSTARGRADSVDLSLTQNSLTAGVVPGPPLNLVADQGPGFVWLWWNHPATNGDQLIKNYQIFRGATAGSETLLDTIHVGATQYSDPLTFSSLSLNGLNFYNDTTATAGSTFFYEVRAVSDAGNSSFSNEVSANPSLTGDAPNAPSATGTGMTYSAQINWTAATVVSGPPARFFYLYRNDSFFPEPIAASFGAGGYQDQVGFLAATIGEVNNYTVKAANTYGEGAGSYLHLFIGGTGTIPSAPLNLTALGLNKSVLLTWDRPLNPSSLGFDNYQIARSNSESGPFVAISNQSTTGLFGFEGFYFDSAVVNGQKYFYEVTAMRGTNVSTPSNVANATPNAFVFPFEVNTLNAYPGDGKILLIWSDAFNATGYQIWRGDASNAEALLTTVSPTSFYIDSTVTNGNPYFYKVIAVHLSTTSPPSPEASATPSTGNPPAAPSITCTPDSGGVTVYNPTTPVTSPIIGWKVYRGNSAGTENPVAIDNITSIQFDTAFDYTDTATVVDQNYYYEIAAVNLYGTSPLSNEASSFNSPTGDVPDPVTSISATGMTGGIQVTWSSPTYEGTAILLGYELVRNTSVGGWEAVTSPIIAVRGTTQYTDHSAMAGVTYQYRVLATNLYGDASAFSPAASASASAGTVASAPQSLVATSGTGFVLLSWLAPTSAGNPAFTMYEVFRSTTSGAYTTPLATVDEPTTTYNDTSAVTGTPYFYVVKAMNTAGLSPASNEVTGTATAPPTAASAPLGLHAESGGGFILLNWTAPTSAGNPAFTRYDIYRSTTSGEYGSPIGNVAAGTLVFNDTSPIIGTPYFYVVKAVNTAGSSPASNEVTGTAAVGPQLATAP